MARMSRREQLELDELLSDIYRGIETLSDTTTTNNNISSSNNNKFHNLTSRHYDIEDSRNQRTIGRAHIREYELDASSPLVEQYKRDIANSQRKQPQQHQNSRSTLKRQQTPQQQQQQQQPQQLQKRVGTPAAAAAATGEPQSLASFMSGNPVSTAARATPEHKRRVRIVDHRSAQTLSPAAAAASAPYIDAEDYANDDVDEEDENYYAAQQRYQQQQQQQQQQQDSYVGSPFDSRQKVPNTTSSKKQKVKYVNTNKLIYHQEKSPEDFEAEQENNYNNDDENDEDDEYNDDAKTRVEYYHTTWLDRQLGRASKRRSSKELTERQVKEKAMIEELKRSLKNGAITLRQSFNNKHNNKRRSSENLFDDGDDDIDLDHQIRDDYFNRQQNNRNNSRSIFKTGIATIPRHLHNNNNNNSSNNNSSRPAKISGPFKSRSPVPVTTLEHQHQQSTKQSKHKQTQMQYSRTLPHKKQQDHQLLQSHYRGGGRMQAANVKPATSPADARSATLQHQRHNQQQQQQPYNDQHNHQQQQQQQHYNTMRDPYSGTMPARAYNQPGQGPFCASFNADNAKDQQLLRQQLSGAKSPMQQFASSTLNRMPSATDVVRTALSRSGSQTSLNNAPGVANNKTISLMPNSPPPYVSSTTPTQQLRSVLKTPTLSPSPLGGVDWTSTTNKTTTTTNTTQYAPTIQTTNANTGQITLHGTRTIPSGRQPNIQQQQQHQQQQQPQTQHSQTPHASLMQHRQEQQMRQTNSGNSASIREFNELDSLLRSLSPGASYATRPTSSITNNNNKSTPAQMVQPNGPGITPGFSSRPAQASFGGYMSQKQPQAQQQQQQQTNDASMYARVQKQNNNNNSGQLAPYTIDVTENRPIELDENCHQIKQSPYSAPVQTSMTTTMNKQQQLQQRFADCDISEFEPKTEVLPSMEDYQNISKLNPVNNRYWYKPNMARDHAINLLRDKPQGTFIVRDSTSFRNAYGLAVKVARLPKNVLNNNQLRNYNSNDPSAELIRHFLIEPVGAGSVRLKGYANEPVFDNLADLIYQHSLTELALPCKLVIPRADIEDPQFNYKQKQFNDEFLASKEQAKHQPYERTSPNGGYRRYPGDVLIHNEHRIIFE